MLHNSNKGFIFTLSKKTIKNSRMKTGIYHTTVFTTSNGILLKKQSMPNIVETYCIGYSMQTGKRDKSYDGYYYNSELTSVIIK